MLAKSETAFLSFSLSFLKENKSKIINVKSIEFQYGSLFNRNCRMQDEMRIFLIVRSNHMKEISFLLLTILSCVTHSIVVHTKPKIYYHEMITIRCKIVALLSAFGEACAK